jgi:hypothetical protein
MSFEKAEVVADVYRNQADALESEIEVARKRGAMHEGARDIMKILSKNISGVMGQTEVEVEGDDNLDSDSKIRTLRHVGTALTRVATAIQETARNQQNKVLEANAIASVLQTQQSKFRKLAESTMAQAKRKLEIELEQADAPSSEEPTVDLHPSSADDDKPPRKRRRSRKRNGAAKEA